MKILFITSNRVGDAVLSTGLLAWLTRRYGGAQFTIACGPYAAGLFRAVPGCERIIVLEKKSWNRHWLDLWRQCAGTRWDVIADLRDSVISRVLRANRRIYRFRAPGQHKVIELAAAIGVAPPPPLEIWLDEKAEAEAAQLLPSGRPLLALAPGANWPCKQWPAERFAELAKRLIAPGAPLADSAVLVIAGADERAQSEPLLNALPADRRVEVIGRDLLTVAACLKRCRLFIGNDSGVMHIAAAMDIPTLGLFGPGYEEIYGPWGTRCGVIRTPESREELLARLPNVSAREPNLMGGLSVETVYTAATELLKL